MALTFGERLQDLRTERGISQDTIAQFMGVTRTTVSGWECNKSRPRQDRLNALAQYFHVSYDYLVGSESYTATSDELKEIVCEIDGKAMKIGDIVDMVKALDAQQAADLVSILGVLRQDKERDVYHVVMLIKRVIDRYIG